jgi:predicted RNase H-like nuclease (RuvC/YqgF family)
VEPETGNPTVPNFRSSRLIRELCWDVAQLKKDLERHQREIEVLDKSIQQLQMWMAREG